MVRVKNRYLLCEIVFADGKRLHRELTEYEIYNCVKNAVIQSHGEYGIGSLLASFRVMHYKKPNIVIIRAGRGNHHMLQSAMFFIKKIGRYEAFLQTLHIGGTIRTCQKFYLRYLQNELPTLLLECKTEEEKSQVKKAIELCTLVEEKGKETDEESVT